MKDLLLRAPVVVRTSNMKISPRRRLADYVKTLHQKACRTCSTIIFLHSTNEIIDLWRYRWRCRRQILNSLFAALQWLLFCAQKELWQRDVLLIIFLCWKHFKRKCSKRGIYLPMLYSPQNHVKSSNHELQVYNTSIHFFIELINKEIQGLTFILGYISKVFKIVNIDT